MTDKQIIIDENKINPNDWLEPYKPIPACEIKDCNELVYCGDGILGCRIAEDGLVCDDFNNDDECCMYRQLEYYKEALKRKEQECERLNNIINEAKNNKLDLNSFFAIEATVGEYQLELDQLKAENETYKKILEDEEVILALNEVRTGERHIWFNKAEKLKQTLTEIKEIAEKHQATAHCCYLEDMTEILQKISECEVEDE